MLLGHEEWFKAKQLDMEAMQEQAGHYSHTVMDRIDGVLPEEEPQVEILLRSLFAAAFQMGYNVSEARSLAGEENPLARDLRTIADSPEGVTVEDLRRVARVALLREGIG